MSTVIVWYYRTRPTLTTFEWTRYRDIQIDLIEEAFQNKKTDVFLDECRLDLTNFIQIDLNDDSVRCPIKREDVSYDRTSLRQYRFASLLKTTSSSSFGSHDSWCPFLKAWLQTPSGKRAVIDHRKCLEACAQGIIKEGELHHSKSKVEAAYMAGKILQCIGRPTIEATQLCINLYTKDSFLYYVLNKTLREEDHSKLETLGPYCFLLRNYSRYSQDYIGTVYRGVQLNEEQIEAYKGAISHWKTWPAFTSTSKDREVAKAFGNTLFIIDISRSAYSLPRSFDIAEISHFPHEQEILIPAGTSFQIINVEKVSAEEYIVWIRL